MSEQFSRDTQYERIYHAFAALLDADDEAIDLTHAALLMASIEYPDVDFAPTLAYLDLLAQRTRAILSPSTEQTTAIEPQAPFAVVEALNTVLFEEEQFHGNQEDYYNLNNSFLNKVIELRTGIPITLSLLYMEVARRVGVHIDGIGAPYHFLVRYQGQEGIIYIDPFLQGMIMSEESCRERLRKLTQYQSEFQEKWLQPVSHRYLLLRILNNLKRIYINDDQFQSALAICNLILLIAPHEDHARRERGYIHIQLKHYSRALRDLTTYLDAHPDTDDRYELRNQIKSLRNIIALLN
ncbi:MAG TPA: transglutaminase-like domain-containing protein [Dictyobacter sp.]|jgi:regulator of sirC expression with transglutaminase-like and TPR domain|nr:transglutaminase-like domain-containing protein [Dictyobacter sp.]